MNDFAGRYRVLSELGSGGTGRVFLVEDKLEKKRYALKTLAHLEQAARFKREFYTLAQLDIPGVVRVYDFGMESGNFFYTMEYITGKSLDELSPPLPWEDVAKILCSISDTLESVHSYGILHCDLKPSNIFLEGDRTVLVDFGLRGKNGVSGTLPYIAPEVIRKAEYSTASDMYSLGVIGYELLYGINPFYSDAPQEVINRQLELTPDFPEQDADRELVWLIRSLLEKKPTERISSAGRAKQILSAILYPEKKETISVVRHIPGGKFVGRDKQVTFVLNTLKKLNKPTFLQLVGSGKSRFLKELSFVLKTEKVLLFPAFETSSMGDILAPLLGRMKRGLVRNELSSLVAQGGFDPERVARLILLASEQVDEKIVFLSDNGISRQLELVLDGLGDSVPYLFISSRVPRAGGPSKLELPQLSADEVKEYLFSIFPDILSGGEIAALIFSATGGDIKKVRETLVSLSEKNGIKRGKDGVVFDAKILSSVIGASLDEVISSLPKPEKRLLELLSLFPHGLPSERLFKVLSEESSLHLSILLRKGLILESDDGLYRIISKAVQRHLFPQAISYAEKYLKKILPDIESEKNPYFLLDVGTLLYRLSGLDEAKKLLFKSGRLFLNSFDIPASRRCFFLFCSIAKRRSDRISWIKGLKNIALGYKRIRDFDRAREYYRKALKLSEGDKAVEGGIYNDLGVVDFEAGKIESALSNYQRALEMLSGSGKQEIILLNNIGNIHLERGEIDKAESLFRKALEIARDISHLQFESILLLNLAYARLARGNFNDAVRFARESAAISHDRPGGEPYYAEALLVMTEACLSLGRFALSHKALNEAAEITAKLGGRLKLLELRERLLLSAYTSKRLDGTDEMLAFSRLFPEKEAVKLLVAYYIYSLAIEEKIPQAVVEKIKELYKIKIISDREYGLVILLSALRFFPVSREQAVSLYQEGCLHPTDDVLYQKVMKMLEPLDGMKEGVSGIDRFVTGSDRAIHELLDVILAINSERSLDALFSRILDGVIRVARTERALLFIREGEGFPLVAARGEGGRSIPLETVRWSRSIVDKIKRTGESVLAENALEDEQFSVAASVIDLKLRTVLAVPVRFGSKLIGIIYTDSKAEVGRFTDEDMRILDALSQQVGVAIQNTSYISELESEREALRAAFGQLERLDFIGESDAIRSVLERVSVVAPTDFTVLITGETGVGKELLARIIHANSRRKDKPFVVVNCAAIPETLLESELFGYEKGAFTGATTSKPGLFELADAGTLFMDEIGDMPLAIQAKLLRAIEDKSIQRLGGRSPVKVDVRIIAATNRELEALCKDGRFRQDLFFRLSGIRIKIPPLRERPEDIPLLVERFVKKFAHEIGKEIIGISPLVIKYLRDLPWNGNVRELENLVREMVLFSKGKLITVDDIPSGWARSAGGEETPIATSLEEMKSLKKRYCDEVERKSIEAVLKKCGWNVTRAAELFGINRVRLHSLIKKHGLRRNK
ncbi:sigma 54-interacting transcriptional regulator [bacterium]|nr:sigma 54-interacting transcriptional regulator [bacterium]